MELRPLRAVDIELLASWLPRAAADVRCERWSDANALREVPEASRILACVENGPVAFLEYELGAPTSHAAQVRFLAVEPGKRRLGAGGRAALSLERRLKRSIEEIYVCMPERLGLTLYFWLRLGYRPLTQRNWPVAAGDGPATWMVRRLR